MKLWSVSSPSASKNVRGLAAIGLFMLAALSAHAVHAANADNTSAPAPERASDPAKPKPKPKAKSIAAALGSAECVRTGQRVVAALARDDSGAASQFYNFYIAFKCPPQHLAQAFGCLVNLQTANPGLTNPTSEQVTQCWNDPAEVPKVLPPPAPDAAGDKK